MEMTPITAGAFAGLLERATGQQLVPGRRWRIETALGPIMRARGLETLDHLAALACGAQDPSLGDEVVEALLNHETFFFRDIGAFNLLASEALPALADRCGDERRLRIWSAGCSTGQEAYSLVLALGRHPRWAGWDVSILGTDISRQAIARARAGLYSQFEIQRGLPIGDMIAHFQAEGDQWRASPMLRDKVMFRQHNLLDVPPPGRFDLVLCRNVLLYFPPDRRRAVLDRLAESMVPDGMLVLGAGETVLGQSDAFDPDHAHRGVYRPRAKGAR